MPLVCAVYFDLPKPYQAFLFATINSNQKSVDKSQTYELFGYNIEDEPSDSWTPDKLGVFLSRKLNSEKDSPFHEHIIIAAENDIVQSIAEARRKGDWMVSTATVVGGIVKLISQNPKADAYKMHEDSGITRSRSVLSADAGSEKTPLRPYFIQNNDKLIYTIVKNYFVAVAKVLWEQASDGSFIYKTIGIQALFDIARIVFGPALEKKVISVDHFSSILKPAKSIDFADKFFHASGAARTSIRNMIEIKLGLRKLEDVAKASDLPHYRRLLRLD